MQVFFDLYDKKKQESITDRFNTIEALNNCYNCLKNTVKYKNINNVVRRRIVDNDDFSYEKIEEITEDLSNI